jgi:hypothetical protein
VAGQPGPLWFGRGQCRRSLGPELLSAVAAPEGLAWRIDHPASSAPTARQAAEAEAPAGMILHSPPPHDHVGPARLAPCPEPAIELPLAAAHRRHVPHGTDRSPPDAPALRRAMLGLAARPPPYVRNGSWPPSLSPSPRPQTSAANRRRPPYPAEAHSGSPAERRRSGTPLEAEEHLAPLQPQQR